MVWPAAVERLYALSLIREATRTLETRITCVRRTFLWGGMWEGVADSELGRRVGWVSAAIIVELYSRSLIRA